MTLQQLKYMILIAESGSISRGAERAYIAQPSLSASLKELEQELGFTLFTRTNRGLSLTPDGMEFLVYARQVVDQYALLEGKFLNRQGDKKKFAIATQHYSFAVEAFIQLTAKLNMEEYDFAIRETKTQEVIEDVRTLRSELGILHLNSFNTSLLRKVFADYALSFHPLITCPIYVYLWKGNPLAVLDVIKMEQLQDYPYLSFELGSNSSFYYAEEVLSTYHYKKTIKATDRATMLNLMRGLRGYTLCSGVISKELNGDDYIAIPLDHREQMEIGYIKKKDVPLSALALQYLEHICAVLGHGTATP